MRTKRLVQGALILLVPLAAAVVYQVLTWPDVAAVGRENPRTTAFLERSRSEARRRGEPEPSLRWVPYARISPHLKRAVLVAEDIDFHAHHGFAWGEIQEAWRERREEGGPLRGASTLTQQLAKNLWLSPSRNPWRKVKEAILTWQLERNLSKRRIFELYLNVAQFGSGTFGAEVAARRFFGGSAADLTEDQAAALAAALPSPSRWFPGSRSETAGRRAALIRRRMDRARWLWKVI